MRAWEKGDLDAIIALLHDDVTFSMPPSPTWIAGRADVARFFTNRVVQAVRTALVDANGRTGAGFYALAATGRGPSSRSRSSRRRTGASGSSTTS